MQQLGEAIHESVSESEHIAGVVKDIRKQGFGVVVRDARQRIGLNRAGAPARGALELDEPDRSRRGERRRRFHRQDLHFLKSLRISIEEHESTREAFSGRRSILWSSGEQSPFAPPRHEDRFAGRPDLAGPVDLISDPLRSAPLSANPCAAALRPTVSENLITSGPHVCAVSARLRRGRRKKLCCRDFAAESPRGSTDHERHTRRTAGGRSRGRLFPLTRDRAKPAVPFGGNYRIIDITLSNCINSDLRRVYILTQYKALSLNRHIREGWTSVVAQELGEFIEILPPMQRVSANWYMGTADAVYQNIYSIGVGAAEAAC